MNLSVTSSLESTIYLRIDPVVANAADLGFWITFRSEASIGFRRPHWDILHAFNGFGQNNSSVNGYWLPVFVRPNNLVHLTLLALDQAWFHPWLHSTFE